MCGRRSHHSIRLDHRSISSAQPLNASSRNPVSAPHSSPLLSSTWAVAEAAYYLMARNGISLACYPTEASNAYSIALGVISHKDTLLIPVPPASHLDRRGKRLSALSGPSPAGPWRIKVKLNLTAGNAMAIYMQSLKIVVVEENALWKFWLPLPCPFV